MSKILTLICMLAFIGCSKGDDKATVETPVVEEVNPYAAFAGDWKLNAFAMDSDESLVAVGFRATDSEEGWSMMFPNVTDPVANSVMIMDDSVHSTAGPYASALRKGAMVTKLESMLHSDGNVITGRFTATYDKGKPAVMHGRLKGVRVE